MTYTVSDEGLAIIKHWEGFRAKPYRCPAGVPTIGYGSTLGVTMSMDPITREQADALLRREVAQRYTPAVVAAIQGAPETDQTDIDAMVSLCYNIGVGAFAKSSVARLHRKGDKAGAAQAFLLWDKATVKGKKVRLEGLARRRQSEASLYMEGSVAIDTERPIALEPISQSDLDKGLEPRLESAATPSESNDKGLVNNHAAKRNVTVTGATGGLVLINDQMKDYQAKLDQARDMAEQAQASAAKAQAMWAKAQAVSEHMHNLSIGMWVCVALILAMVLWSSRDFIRKWAAGEQ